MKLEKIKYKKKRLRKVQVFKKMYVLLYYFDIKFEHIFIYIFDIYSLFISFNIKYDCNSINDNNWISKLFERKYNMTYRQIECSLGIVVQKYNSNEIRLKLGISLNIYQDIINVG